MAEIMGEYVVRVVGLGSEEEEKKPQKNGLTSGLEGLKKAMNPIENFLKHKKGEGPKTYFGKEIAKNAISTLETVTNLTVNRYFRLSEDYKGQNYLNNVMRNINIVKNSTSSALTGAIAGSAFGPGGAIVGGLVSGGSSIANQIIQYQNTIIEYKTALNATRVETAFRAERAGLYDGGKGTEN